ncbi:MAG: ATP-NAD kinase family protein [Bacteroidales bacterium]|nr:ATP-NAD kinase family protein [Bacteroidales bacterium]
MTIKKKIGLIINPFAGMGGSVGLKGTDGEEILRKSMDLGAIPQSAEKVAITLRELLPIKDAFSLITCPGDMGHQTVIKSGLEFVLINVEMKNKSSAEETIKAADEIRKLDADIIAFAGGDGTARDIHKAIGNSMLVLGIPTGVKIHSGVFASHPSTAGVILKDFILGKLKVTREAEVMDIDEVLYRQEILTSKLYGYLKIPASRHSIQNRKTGSMPGDVYFQEAIAHDVIENIENNCYYLIGPGTTTRALMLKLGLKGSLLGVDLVFNNKLVGKDLNERQILERIKDTKVKLILTPTRGQGFILGRGNQQLSSHVLKIIGKENIIILATPEKISSLSGHPFLIDTGSPLRDKEFSGHYKIITGYHQYTIYKAKG